VISSNGHLTWYQYNQIHREDGPAVFFPNGRQVWYKHGEIHRNGDGPSIILPYGTEYWYKNRECYRAPIDGKPMPVIVSEHQISYDGTTFIPISDYEKYRYHSTGRFTKSARQ
jgi:hypothetical protein